MYAELAEIHEALIERGVTPREADELYLWEIAVLLGAHRPEVAVAGSAGPSDLVRARIAHAQNPTNPAPVPQPAGPEATELLTRTQTGL